MSKNLPLKFIEIFNATMKIYVLQLLIESSSNLASPFDSSKLAEPGGSFDELFSAEKGSETIDNVLIINLLFVFICQAAKKLKLKKSEKRIGKKKCLLSDRSPSLGQINDFTRITFSSSCSSYGGLILSFSLFVVVYI